MSRLTPEKKHRLAYWLQQNRSATDRARLEVTKDELRDLDADVLLHLAAMAFITLDKLVQTVSEEPARRENLMALSKSLGDQLEQKNTAEMRPHAERGKKVKKSASDGGNEKNAKNQAERPKYQVEIDRLHATNPRLSFEEMKRRAADTFNVSTKTIGRHTTNPKSK